MKAIEFNRKLDQIKDLAKTAKTGTPRELGKMLNVSERTARRLIEHLRAEKFPIEFCRRAKSYVIREKNDTMQEKNVYFEIPVPF